MTSLRAYKFVVTAIVQEVEDDGNVVGEIASEPVTLYGVASLAQFADGFDDNLARSQQT